MRPALSLFASVLLACASFAARADDLALPATLEGTLVIEVPAADIEDNTTASNFGTLTVGDTGYAVDVPTPVLEKSGVPAGGGPVRATLGAMDDGDGFPVYTVTALESR